MVELKPFRKLRYKIGAVGGDISKVATLPYDIITPGKQEEYYRLSPYSFVRLILAKDEEGDGENDKYERVRRTLDDWLKKGVLVEDDEEALYIYEEAYESEGRAIRQAGIVGMVKVEPFEAGKILPHEQILEKPLADRFRLLKATQACLEMIIGLFPDIGNAGADMMRKYMTGKPQLDFVHADNIRHRIWKITDKADIETMQRLMKGNNIIIADGHHRYTTAVRYLAENGGKRGTHIMMLLWPMDDKLNVMPTHRLLRNIPARKYMIRKISAMFDVSDVGGLEELTSKMADAGGHAFGLYDGGYHLLRLRDERSIDEGRDVTRSGRWNALDVNVLQLLLMGHCLRVDYKVAANGGDLAFVKDARKAVERVDSGEFEAAFLLNPTRIAQIYEIAKSGERMPQKSTYFYPKPLSGLLMCRL